MMENLHPLVLILVKIIAIVAPLMLSVAYLTYAERKVIGFIQGRIGPNRLGIYGLLQPIADGIKLLTKEIIFPSNSNKLIFILAPVMTITPALAAWAVIPFSGKLVLANLNIGLLYVLAMSSITVYGVVLAGWAANSQYALLGALRVAAQTISYEIAMSFTLVAVVLAAKSFNLTEIVLAQSGSIFHWYWLPMFPLLVIYWIAAVAETNRAPFDMAEGESEIVAGFHVEHSGMGFALFFLAEYANMILVSILASIMFLGGWLSPFTGTFLEKYTSFVPDTFWLMLKTAMFLFSFLWFRATFPRFRYDRVMRLGWKILVPASFIWTLLIIILARFKLGIWFNL